MVEKLGKMSKHVYIDGEQSGRLILRCDTSFLGLKTYFSNLSARHDYVTAAETAKASVKIDARRMSTILNYSHVSLSSAVLCISENEALVLHLTLAPIDMGSVTFYLPVLLNETSGIDIE